MSSTNSTLMLAPQTSAASLLKRYAGLGIIAAMMLCTTFSAWSHTTALHLQDAWIRGTAPGQTNGAAYIQIHNGSNHEMTLESVSSPRANRVELHTVDRESGVARMREIGQITLAANQTVKLAPGGYHIMLVGLTEPFQSGETVTLILNFKGYDPMPVEFKVMPPTHQPQASAHSATSGSTQHANHQNMNH